LGGAICDVRRSSRDTVRVDPGAGLLIEG